MENYSWRFMMPDIAFHRTSTRPIPWKSATSPLGIITTVCQTHGDVCSEPLKDSCMSVMNFPQFPGSGSSSRFYARCQILRCYALIPERSPARCSRSRITASAKIYSPVIVSSTRKGGNLMIIGIPRGRTWV